MCQACGHGKTREPVSAVTEVGQYHRNLMELHQTGDRFGTNIKSCH